MCARGRCKEDADDDDDDAQLLEASFGTYIDNVTNGGLWDQTFYYGPIEKEMASSAGAFDEDEPFSHNTVGIETTENEDEARDTDPLLPLNWDND